MNCKIITQTANLLTYCTYHSLVSQVMLNQLSRELGMKQLVQ